VAARPGFAEHCAIRFGMDYVLRLLHELSLTFEGDLISGLIFMAVVRANGQHLADPVQQGYSSAVGVIPDEARRPVSVKSVSDSLNIPYETVRRHLRKLCDGGWCRRVEAQGYLVPQEVLLREDSVAVMERNYSNFQLLLARSQRAGLDLSATAAGEAAPLAPPRPRS
jgi:hypothetical protein